MKHLLLTTIAAVVLVGCGESQQSVPPETPPSEPVAEAPTPPPPPAETKPVEPVAEAPQTEPPTVKTPEISINRDKTANPEKLVKTLWFARSAAEYVDLRPILKPGYSLWERNNDGVWVETESFGPQYKYKEEERAIVNGVSGDVVVQESGDISRSMFEATEVGRDISKTGTRDGSYRVFIPDYDKSKLLPLYSRNGGKKKDGKWTSPCRKTKYKIEVIQTRDGEIYINKKELADLLRKHGGKTGEELKAEGK